MPCVSVPGEFHPVKSLLDTRDRVRCASVIYSVRSCELMWFMVISRMDRYRSIIIYCILFTFQSSSEVKPFIEPPSSTSLRRREHRLRRATNLSEWIRRPSSQITSSSASGSSAEDRRQGAHRCRQGKFTFHLSYREFFAYISRTNATHSSARK